MKLCVPVEKMLGHKICCDAGEVARTAKALQQAEYRYRRDCAIVPRQHLKPTHGCQRVIGQSARRWVATGAVADKDHSVLSRRVSGAFIEKEPSHGVRAPPPLGGAVTSKDTVATFDVVPKLSCREY